MSCFYDARSLAVVDKYLTTYADSSNDHIYEVARFGCFEFVLVIPAYRESQAFIENLKQIAAQQKDPILIIVVLNAPDNHDDADRDNNTLLEILLASGRAVSYDDDLHVVEIEALVIAIMGPHKISSREGVGRARKMGCDAALALIKRGIVSTPLIFCTDADAGLPEDYFTRGREAWRTRRDISCLIYPYSHLPPKDRKQRRAIELYEMRLAAYVMGLHHANSPYAFHTIGSTLAVDASSYAKVRGFPKLPAGEDFYILNKLAKLGAVVSLGGEAIKLSARLSTRVPFGTGPSLIRIVDQGDSAAIFYDSRVFSYVRSFITHALADVNGMDRPAGEPDVDVQIRNAAFHSLKGHEKLFDNLRMRSTPCDRARAFHEWFDAFRTLKFIHYLRDTHFPLRSFHELRD